MGEDEAAKNEGSRESGRQKKKTGEETVGLVNGRYYGDNRDDGDQATLFLPMAILSP
jgi:hypothetical protein